MTQINLVFNMVWHMGILKIQQESASDKVLRDKVFNIAKNPKYDKYQRGLSSTVYKFFGKMSAGTGVNTHANNEKLAEELHKRIVYSGFKDNIWGADLANMQLISKFNKGFKFLQCLINIFSKYALLCSFER